jgi:hypothetical protein
MQGATMALLQEFGSRRVILSVWLLRFASVWRLQLQTLRLCNVMQPCGSMLHCSSYSRAQ